MRNITTASSPNARATARPPTELTPAQVAREFAVSPATIRRWEGRGILLPRRLPISGHRRYDPADVAALKQRIADGDPSLQRQGGAA